MEGSSSIDKSLFKNFKTRKKRKKNFKSFFNLFFKMAPKNKHGLGNDHQDRF